MDTYVDGDFEINVQGYPKVIYGIDEVCQKAKFILSVKKGSYKYDRELGIDCTQDLLSVSPERVSMLCKEACAKYGIDIVKAKIETQNYISKIKFTVAFDGENQECEVDFY